MNSVHRSDIFKNYAEIAALVLAGIWAFYTFFFQSDYAQSRARPQLNVQPSIEVIGRNADGLAAVRARVLVKNTSNARVDLIGSWFNIFGYKASRQIDDALAAEKGILDKEGTFLDAPKLIGKGKGEVINRGRLLPARWHYEPSEETLIEFVTFVPDDFDLVELRANFLLSKEEASSFWVSWKFKEAGRLDIDHGYADGPMPEGAYTYTYGIAQASLWPTGSGALERGEKASAEVERR